MFCGGTEEEVAQSCRISYATLANWKNQYPEFLEAIKTDVKTHLQEVVSALLKRAKGMIVIDVEETIEDVVTKDGKVIRDVRRIKTTTKNLPPDVGAINTILANRDFAKWRRNDPPGSTGNDDWMKSPETVADAMLKQSETILGIV